MSDLLSSASLILAVVGILYGLWYPEITKTLEKDIPEHREDRGKIYRELASTIWSRALPLALLSLVVSLIFLRDTLTIAHEQIAQIAADGFGAYLSSYDTVSLVFFAVQIITIAIGLHALVLTARLIKRRFRR